MSKGEEILILYMWLLMTLLQGLEHGHIVLSFWPEKYYFYYENSSLNKYFYEELM